MGEKKVGQPPGRLRRWLRRLVKGFLLFLLLIVLILVGIDIYWRHIGATRLAAAVDEATKQDEKWRWDDLQASRAAVADEDNAAFQIDKIAAMLQSPWAVKTSLLPEFNEMYPPVRLDSRQVQAAWIDPHLVAPALAEAHALARFRTGRFPAGDMLDAYDAKEARRDRMRAVARLLSHEAVLLAEDGKVSEAVISARTIFHAGRAVGDEPGDSAMEIHQKCQAISVRSIERALAQGEASDGVLGETARLLHEEDSTDLLTPGLRGQRAEFFEVCGLLEAGELERLAAGRDSYDGYDTNTWGHLKLWLSVPSFRENRARGLEWATRAVAYAALPFEEQPAKFEQLKQEINRTDSDDVDSIRWHRAVRDVHLYPLMAEVNHYLHAQLRCATAALAAERYRLAKGKWPDALDALVPAYLPAVPKDPYTGEAIRLRRVEDGLIIYSVGQDGKDDGGNLDHLSKEKHVNIDYGFRLWDVKYRHQAPPGREPGLGMDR